MRPLCLVVVLSALPTLVQAQEPADAERSKKERFLVEKAARRTARRALPPPRAVKAVTLRNLWTLEVLPIDPTRPPPAALVDRFLRCHFTNQSIRMDPRLSAMLLGLASKLKAAEIDIVSAYRAPKYNLYLRKKGREVARESAHPRGHAIDFRVVGVPTRELLGMVRRLRLGGVGYYPESGFVHSDLGPSRFWRGR